MEELTRSCKLNLYDKNDGAILLLAWYIIGYLAHPIYIYNYYIHMY